MSAYQELMDFQSDLYRRAAAARGREQKILTELAGMEANYPESVIRGEGQAVQDQIDKLRGGLQAIRRELTVLENPPVGGHLKDLIRAVWQEAADLISKDLRQEWDVLAAKAAALKDQFLTVVSELGQVKRRSDSITSRATEVMLQVGGKMAVPSLSTGVISRPDRKEGVIYINPIEIEKTFKQGA